MAIVDGIPVLGPSAFARGPRGPNITDSDVGFLDAISGPAWRKQNVTKNLAMGGIATYDAIDPADRLDVWSEIEGTKYERHFSSFAPLVSREEVEAMKRRLDLAEEDQRVIEEAGFGGFAAEAIATVIDLPTLIPFGAAIGGARAGLGVMRVGARTAFAAGAEATFAEGILQATQETRTGTESAFAIGGSIILGGLLGSAPTAVVGRL